MKKLLPIFVSLALVIAYGCEKDDDDNDDDTPAPQTNAPSQNKAEPKPTEPQYCFPTNYSVPQGIVDSTNQMATTTQTIGLPDDPYYQVTVTTVSHIITIYDDGTTYSADGTTIGDTIVNAGTTNTTLSNDHMI